LSRTSASSEYEKHKWLPVGGQEGGGKDINPGNVGRTDHLEGGS